MKKVLIVLAVLVMASPLYAGTITFTTTDNADGTCDIGWTSDVAVVALGLDIDCDDPCLPVNIDSIDSFFDIFMDLAWDEETNQDGYVYAEGSGTANNAGAKKGEAGKETMPSAAFAISAGGLGGPSTPPPLTPPPMSGTIVLSSPVSTSGTVGANALRGGVIDENGVEMTIAGDSTWTITVEEGDCMQEAGIDISDPVRYTHFLAAGSPECWCEPRQCHGDADNALIGTSTKTGYYAVGGPDLDVLLGGWGVLEPPDDIGIAAVPDIAGTKAACANFDNDAVADPLVPGSGTLPGGRIGTSTKTGYYYVGGGDLDILLAYWGILEPPDDVGVPGDCVPGNR